VALVLAGTTAQAEDREPATGGEERLDERGAPPASPKERWLSTRTPGFDLFSPDSGGSWMLLGGLRVTSTTADGAAGLGREVDDVGGQLGGRAHLMGTIDFVTVRFEAEGWFGGGRDGVDAEGAAHVAVGLAQHADPDDAAVLRLGAGARAFGNPALDVEIVEAPALEAGFQHHDEDLFVDLAPLAALVPIVHVGAGDDAERDTGVSALGGARAVVAAAPFWATVDYAAVVTTDVFHLGGGSVCLAPGGIAGCIDARFAAAVLLEGAARAPRDVVGAYAGLSVGVGGTDVGK